MIKNKLDFKLINISLIVLIVYLMYRTGNLWIGVASKIWTIIMPFFFAFVLAYSLHPLVKALEKRKIPRGLAIFIVIAMVVGIIVFIGCLVAPIFINQLTSLFNSIMTFIKELSLDFDLNLGTIQDSLNNTFNDVISKIGADVSEGAINFIGSSISVLSTIFIGFSAAIYFLIDMDNIRNWIKKTLKKKSKKMFQYVGILDNEMKNYLSGFIKIIFISFFEYNLVFLIIGHPNALLLGTLAAFANLIPYFGGIMTNVIAAVTAFVINPLLFVRTIIAFLILSIIDGYLINPLVYGKTNKVHPIIVILSVFAGGILFGTIGIVISLPLAIILLATYKFFEDDISDKIEDIKEGKQ